MQRTSEILFQHEKGNFVSPSGHVNFFYYINTNGLPNHFTLIVFWCERRDLLCSRSNGYIFTCEDKKGKDLSISSPRGQLFINCFWYIEWAQGQTLHEDNVPENVIWWTMKTNILENGCYFYAWMTIPRNVESTEILYQTRKSWVLECKQRITSKW